MEFGARRAYGPEAAIEASKCSIIGGAIGTSNVIAGKKYNMPILGTMAHSMITEASNEKEAFLNYAKTYPENCVLLVDTRSNGTRAICITIDRNNIKHSWYATKHRNINNNWWICTICKWCSNGSCYWICLILVSFVLPAVICYLLGKIFRKLNWIKEDDLKLDL